MNAVTHVECVSVSPSNAPALQGISLVLPKGEICGITGPNGAGTSTLAGVLAGDYADYSGDIIVDDRRVSPRSQNEATAAGIGVVRQQLVVIPTFTVLDNLILSLGTTGRISAAMRKDIIDRFNEMTVRYRIPLDIHTSLAGMNGAQQQWVHIARILFSDPQTVVFDQSEVRLGASQRGNFIDLVETLRDENKAVMVISHDRSLLETVSNQVVCLDEGSVCEAFRPDEEHKWRPVNFPDGSPSTHAQTVRLQQFGPSGAEPVDMTIPPGFILGVTGKEPEYREILLAAMGGNLRSVGSLVVGDHLANVKSLETARGSGIHYIPADERLIGAAAGRKLSSLFTGDADSWFGRLFAKSDQALSPLEQLEMITRLSEDGDVPVPALVIVDRPTLGMDEKHQEQVFSLLRRLQGVGATVLIASDSLEELRNGCDSILVINQPGNVTEIPPRAVSPQILP